MVVEPSSFTTFNWGTSGSEPQAISHDLLPHIAPSSTARPGTLDESMATYVASPVRVEDLPEDAIAADDGVVRYLWRSRAVINNIGFTIKDLVENQNASTSCLNNSLRSIAEWAGTIEEKLAQLEAKTSNASFGFSPGGKPMSEIRAINNLDQLGTDKGEFRNWSDKLINALVQKDPKYRFFMKSLKEAMDQKNKLLSDLHENDEVGSII